MERQIVCGGGYVTATLPNHTQVVSPGLSLPLEPTGDLGTEIERALAEPLDTPPLRALVRPGARITLAFDDATVPCYAPVWATAIPLILEELERGGVARENVEMVCANALHRRFTHPELARLVGEDIVARNGDRLRCHDAEDADALVHLGMTPSGYDVEVSRTVTEADLTIYLNCSTTRGFSGGWKSVCVGLSSYRSIHHHHTPDTMSMSLDGNRMHELLDEMGALVERELGRDRIFKLETLLANPLPPCIASSPGPSEPRGRGLSRRYARASRRGATSSKSRSTSLCTESRTGARTPRSLTAIPSSTSSRRGWAISAA
jgi:hypothetical protein